MLKMKLKGKEQSEAMIMIFVYVFFSVGGLVLLKMGASNNFDLSISKGVFDLKINGYLLVGMMFYIMSFITSLVTMKNMNLSVFYPVSAGLGYIGVCVLSYFLLKETITIRQIMGMGLILVGIIVMNLKQ